MQKALALSISIFLLGSLTGCLTTEEFTSRTNTDRSGYLSQATNSNLPPWASPRSYPEAFARMDLEQELLKENRAKPTQPNPTPPRFIGSDQPQLAEIVPPPTPTPTQKPETGFLTFQGNWAPREQAKLDKMSPESREIVNQTLEKAQREYDNRNSSEGNSPQKQFSSWSDILDE